MILRMMLGKKFFEDCLKKQNDCKSALEDNKASLKNMKEVAEMCSYLADMFLFVLNDEDKAMECLELHNSFSELADKYQKHVDTYIGLILEYDEMMNI